MTWFIAFMLALLPAETRLTGLSVASVADRTEVIILVDGAVTPRHFAIAEGNRIVIDLDGVPNAPKIDMRDFNRGGVRELRVSPYQPNVARVVIALEGKADYQLTNDNGRIKVSFANTAGAFEPWSQQVGSAPAAPERNTAATDATDAGLRPIAGNSNARAQQPELYDFEFVDEPLEVVLLTFSGLMGRNIVPAPAQRALPINITLNGVTLTAALEVILRLNNLTMSQLPNGAWIVELTADVAKRRTDEPVQTRTFRIENVTADSIRVAIAPMIKQDSSGGKGVQTNRGNNTLVVTGTAAELDRIERILPQLDVQSPQVDIQTTVAFVTRTALEAMGVTYDLKDSRGNQMNRLVGGFIDRNNDGVLDADEATDEDVVLLGGNSIAGLGNAATRVPGPTLELITSLVLGRHSLIAFLDALQTVSLSDIQAKPNIRIADNRLGTIQVGEQTPIRTIDAGSAGGGQAPVAVTTFKDTGIRLEVTPQVSGNRIILNLFVDRSNVAASPVDGSVLFQTQNVRTVVTVDDGETVVIGGLTIIEKTKSRSGIPLLMDLPVIGKLFRVDQDREVKQDLLIMVKPTIVRD
jgi:type IV pilus assembly protein PilQ